MSTRAQIAIQTGPEEWAHVYVHYPALFTEIGGIGSVRLKVL